MSDSGAIRLPNRLVRAFGRLPSWAWLALAAAFLVAVYRDGLACWFIADDFAWLGLLRQVHDPQSLLRLMFEPAAQGTIRPWSERGFFLLFETLFGLDSLPFRVAAFATAIADLALLSWIVRRLTRSRLAAFVAMLVWSANAALATVMAWSSALNEVLCPLFLLSALTLFIRFTETGRRSFWWWQLVVFSLGFGALEINVVYPVIAAAWVLFAMPPRESKEKRRLLAGLIPLFAISIAYFALHAVAAPLPKTGTYALSIDGRIFETLGTYLKWSLLPAGWDAFGYSHSLGWIVLAIGAAALAVLFVSELRQRRLTTLFFAAWFLATLAPMLPLPGHRMDYYLTIPLFGFAMLAGWGVDSAFSGPLAARVLAGVAVAFYLGGMIPAAGGATHWWLQNSLAVRGLVLGVEAAHSAHPGQAILIDQIDPGLYHNSLGQSALFPLAIDDVYLTPGSERRLLAEPGVADPNRMVLSPEVTFHALQSEQVVIYSVAGEHLRNITDAYERSAPNRFIDRLPDRIEVGNPLYSWLLGTGWLPADSGTRWMREEATLRLRGPDQAGENLVLRGYFAEGQLKGAPRRLTVSVDGVVIGRTQINDPEIDFRRLFPMPVSTIGKSEVKIGIQVDPVLRKDGQDYGALFGKISILP